MKTLLETVLLTRYERIIKDFAFESSAFSSRLSGLTRRVRLSRSFDDDRLQTIWNTGVNVSGPLFFFTVFWLMKESQRKGIKRLYFMARDGYIMHQIALILKDRYKFDVECCYLYGSRQAFILPSVTAFEDWRADLNVKIWLKTQTLEKFFLQCQLRAQDFAQLLEKHSLKVGQGRNLTFAEKIKLAGFVRDPEFYRCLANVIQTLRDNVVGYLKQEGFSDDVPYAVVDSGWLGRCQFAISKVLDGAGLRPPNGINGFYIGLTPGFRRYKNDSACSFLFDLRRSLHNYSLRSNAIYEILAMADHGKTECFKSENSKFIPVFKSDLSSKGLHAVRLHHEAILAFAKGAVELPQLSSLDALHMKKLVSKLVKKFIRAPQHDEALIFGRQNFDLDVTGEIKSHVAPVLNLRNFSLALFDPWWSASLRLSRNPLAIISYFLLYTLKLLSDLILMAVSKK